MLSTNNSGLISRLVKILRNGVIILLILFIGLILFIRSPWGQDIIVQKAVTFLSEKTATHIDIDELYITFYGDINLSGLYLEDLSGDTLVYSRSLKVDIPFIPILRGTGIGVESVVWNGLSANVVRKDRMSGFNFQFLIDAFVTESTANTNTDTNVAEPMRLLLGQLDFRELDLSYEDEVIGINSRVKIGSFQVDVETIDMENMEYGVHDVRLLDVDLHYEQSKAFETSDSENTAVYPKISIADLDLERIHFHYDSKPDGLMATGLIDLFHVEMPVIDLNNSSFKIQEIFLSNSNIAVESTTITKENTRLPEPAIEQKSTIDFTWPDIKVDIQSVQFENNTFEYVVDDSKITQGQFNPNAILLRNVDVFAKHISLIDKEVGLNLERLTFHEGSGIELNEFAFELSLTDSDVSVRDLALMLNTSNMHAQFRVSYPSINAMLHDPSIVQFNLALSDLDFDLNEVSRFKPSLKSLELIDILSRKRLRGQLELEGTLAEMHFNNELLSWGENTHLSFNGTIFNPTEVERLQYTLPNVTLRSSRTDVLLFLDEDSLGIRLPDTITVAISTQGDLQRANGVVELRSTQGDVLIKGSIDLAQEITFDFDASTVEFQLAELLQNEQLGPLSMNIKSKGRGTDPETADAELMCHVSSFQVNGYPINDLKLNSRVQEGKGVLDAQYKDEQLNSTLYGTFVLDSITPNYTFEFDVIGANLEALGLATKPIRTSMRINAELVGDPSAFDLHADIDNGLFVFDNEAYRLGRLDLTAHVNPDTTSAQVRNELIYLDLRSNVDPTTFSKVIVEHFSSYFDSDSLRKDTIPSNIELVLDAKFSPAPILTEVFIDKLVELDTIHIAVDFNEEAHNLDALVSAPHIDYDGYVIDSLFLNLHTTPSAFSFNLGFAEIEAGEINMKATSLAGKGSNGELDLSLVSFDEGEPLIYVDTELRGSKEELRYHIVPEGLLFNKEEWKTPENNVAILTNKKLNFNAFKISRNKQSLELTDEVKGMEKDHIALLFENFELGDFLSYFNPDDELASGKLQGDLILEEPFGNKVLLANLDIDELLVLDVDMGKLSIGASSRSFDKYEFVIRMKEGAIDLDLNGKLEAISHEPKLDLTLDLHYLEMQVIEKFSLDEITETSGSINGYLKIHGPLLEPEYKGKFNFDQTVFNVKRFNAPFNLPSEELIIDNQGLTLADFNVLDVNGNRFTLSGQILTNNLLNPQFDLTVKARTFQILNATKEENDFLYGLAAFNLDGTIHGDLKLPIIDIKLGVDEKTDVTYVLPSAAAAYESIDGVVTFVNRDNPDAILTETNEVTVNMAGFDLKTELVIGNKAKVKVIIDEETGDNFQISGVGDLLFKIDPNGRMSLTGVYEVSSGSYEMNLYNIVNKRFELSPESTVSWSGDPFDAKLDIRAIYLQEASTAPLMAHITSGMEPAAKLKYRQVLPFYVYLDVKGNLDAPELSFALDIPEDKQGVIGGQVYGRIQQVNEQEEELNKQVFSLLVLNRFYPESGSDGSSGGVASVARDNLNDALSDQLNIFSDKLMGQTGVQLNFGLDSYTDYQGDAPTERTQLDVAAKKTLFNDRLIVSVGSEVGIQGSASTDETTPLIGKVNIEYVLTKDGQYRLKGFRRNEFENVIDGQTIVSGMALIFAQEFNEFNELWKAVFRKEIELEGNTDGLEK